IEPQELSLAIGLTDSIGDGTRRGTGDGSGAPRIDADALCQRNSVPLQFLPYGIEALREQRSSANKEYSRRRNEHSGGVRVKQPSSLGAVHSSCVHASTGRLRHVIQEVAAVR